MNKKHITLVFSESDMQDAEVSRLIHHPACDYMERGHVPYERDRLRGNTDQLSNLMEALAQQNADQTEAYRAHLTRVENDVSSQLKVLERIACALESWRKHED